MQAVVVPNTYSVDSCRHGVGGYKRLDGFRACPHLSSHKFQSHPAVPTGRLIDLKRLPQLVVEVVVLSET